MSEQQKLEKFEENLDFLGIYYDSEENRCLNVPDFCEGSLEYSILDIRDGNLKIDGNLTIKDNPNTVTFNATYGGNNITETINKLIPNFYFHNASQKEAFELTFESGRKKTDTKVLLDDLLKEVILVEGKLAMATTIKFNIKRSNNKTVRLEKATGGRNINVQDWFNKVLNPNTSLDSYWYGKLKGSKRFYNESLKAVIMTLTKEERLFTIEYLYGKQLNKASNTIDNYNFLRSQPFNNFGIRDAAVMRKVLTALHYMNKVNNIKEGLLAAGIKPKTDLKRWEPKVPKALTTDQSLNSNTVEVPF